MASAQSSSPSALEAAVQGSGEPTRGLAAGLVARQLALPALSGVTGKGWTRGSVRLPPLPTSVPAVTPRQEVTGSRPELFEGWQPFEQGRAGPCLPGGSVLFLRVRRSFTPPFQRLESQHLEKQKIKPCPRLFLRLPLSIHRVPLWNGKFLSVQSKCFCFVFRGGEN